MNAVKGTTALTTGTSRRRLHDSSENECDGENVLPALQDKEIPARYLPIVNPKKEFKTQTCNLTVFVVPIFFEIFIFNHALPLQLVVVNRRLRRFLFLEILVSKTFLVFKLVLKFWSQNCGVSNTGLISLSRMYF